MVKKKILLLQILYQGPKKSKRNPDTINPARVSKSKKRSRCHISCTRVKDCQRRDLSIINSTPGLKKVKEGQGSLKKRSWYYKFYIGVKEKSKKRFWCR